MIRLAVIVFALACLFVSPAAAQVSCTTAPPTSPVGLVPGQTRLVWTQTDHTAVDQDKLPIIVDYRGEVALASDPGFTKVISNWTIPKASVTVVATGGTGCVSTTLPAMTGLLPANLYVARIQAIGRTQSAIGAVSSNPFFLPGAPQSPANTRLFPPAE